jgi:superfamily II DNA helicase RecQ
MQVRVFSVCPVQNPEGEELNKFLRTHRVLNVSECWSEQKQAWQYSVRFIGEEKPEPPRTSKTDYRELLSDEEFERFSRLRSARKRLAEEDQVPVYVVFTNAELAQLAVLPTLDEAAMQTVKGIGEKRVERYGARLMEAFKSDS